MKKKEKELVESFNLSDRINDVLFDFIDMRAMIKKPMTERAIKMCINKLLKLGTNEDECVAIVEQSIFHNWLDIYPLIKENKFKHQEEEKWTTIE